jgi:hypothetical protein
VTAVGRIAILVTRRCSAVAGMQRCIIDRRAGSNCVLNAVGAERRRPHIDERDAFATLSDRYRNDRPILSPSIELLVRPTAGRHRHPDRGEQLVWLQSRLQEPREEVVYPDLALSVRPTRDEGCSKGNRGRGQIGCRVGVGKRASDRAAVTN